MTTAQEFLQGVEMLDAIQRARPSKGDDHFYGAWEGGSAASGGHPAKTPEDQYGQAWRDTLTPGQLETLQDYSGGEGYAQTNSYLRGYTTPPESTPFFSREMSRPRLDSYVERLDGAVEASPLASNTTFYRSLSVDWDNEEDPINSLFGGGTPESLVGRSAIDPGFLSASLSPGIGDIIQGEYLMEMNVFAGTPAAGILGMSQHPSEKEMLLGRGLRMTITGAREEGRQTVLSVDVQKP